MNRPISLALALLLATGGGLTAQQGAESLPPVSSLDANPTSGSLLSEAARVELGRGSVSAWDRISRHALFTLGFTLVGSGFGYFASQVAYSDWDKVDNSTFAKERRAFSLTGAAIGAVGGFVLGARELSRGPIDSRLPLYQQLAGTDMILGIELEALSVTTAYEAIQIIRPNWLLTRGTQQFREGARGSANGRDVIIIPGETTIRVYVDSAYLGDIDSLRSLQIATIRSIHRLDPAQATTRFGAGHTHGAILVETMHGS